MSGGVIALVDYGMGNRRSVEKALEHVGAAVKVTRDPGAIRDAAGILLPGVGAFPRAMVNLRELGLDGVLIERARAGVPLLGICLGMQLLFERSSELGGADGLGLLPGYADGLQTGGRRLPHIGWNVVSWRRGSALTAGLPDETAFYHVHSFAARPADARDELGSAEYGESFASAVERDNVFGVQFHPEKSSRHGLRLLANFASVCAGEARAAA
ncbi:MAG: imidazole glycerol phosphate synthase subunit HisH [Solirubrobacteraceae bacterium]